MSGHVCSIDDFTVLNYEPHKFKSLIKEPLLVIKDKPLLNKQVQSLKLEHFSFNSTGAILSQLSWFIYIYIFSKNVNIML